VRAGVMEVAAQGVDAEGVKKKDAAIWGGNLDKPEEKF